MTIDSRSEADTVEAGRRLAADLYAGDVVLLFGDLGAGKTAFVRGLAAGLGADSDEVSSPTFALIQEYRGGRLPLYHADLYRLTSEEVPDIGLDELMEGDGVVAVEWAERLEPAGPGTIVVRIEQTGDQQRRIVIARDGVRG